MAGPFLLNRFMSSIFKYLHFLVKHSAVCGCVCAACRPGFYGAGCRLECQCPSGDPCNHVTGECSCPPGYTGKACQTRAFVCYLPNTLAALNRLKMSHISVLVSQWVK